MPTLGDFLSKAEGKGVLVGISDPAPGPDGTVRFRFIQRSQSSPPVVIDEDDSVVLTPVVLSNYCRQMGLDPKDFGLNLGGLSGSSSKPH